MIRLLRQKTVIKTAAVADPPSLRVEGQPRHQHQRGLIIRHRAVFHRLGNTGIALLHLGKVLHPDKAHLIAVALGHCYPLPVPEGLLQHGHGADLLIVRQIAIDALGLPVGFRRGKQLPQTGAGFQDLPFGHGSFFLTNLFTKRSLIHPAPPSSRAGTDGTRGKWRSVRECPAGTGATHSSRPTPKALHTG